MRLSNQKSSVYKSSDVTLTLLSFLFLSLFPVAFVLRFEQPSPLAIHSSLKRDPGDSIQELDPNQPNSFKIASSCIQAKLPTTVAYQTIQGVDPNLLSLDIYLPANSCNAPVVMWVHGGGYTNGDKTNQISNKKRLFNQQGWILVSVNYRLTKPGQPYSAKFPDHFLDVAASVAWVNANIARYGGDPTKIALMGHSAGADIVSNVVTNPTYLAQQGLGLNAVICAAPLDTAGFDKTLPSNSSADNEKIQWKNALGNNPNYLSETSATLSIKPGIGIPPMIGVVRGNQQRQQIETDFLVRLKSAGIPATTINARSLSHAEVNKQIGAPGDTVMTQPVMSFLNRCFQ